MKNPITKSEFNLILKNHNFRFKWFVAVFVKYTDGDNRKMVLNFETCADAFDSFKEQTESCSVVLSKKIVLGTHQEGIVRIGNVVTIKEEDWSMTEVCM